MSRLTEEAKNIIRERKSQGVSSRAIGKEIGYSKSTVNNYWNEYLESNEVDNLEELCDDPDTVVSSLAKRLRTAQRTNSQLRRIQNKVFDQDVNFNDYLKGVEQAVSDINLTPLLPSVNTYLNPVEGRTGATIEILFSDLQIGKVGEQYDTPKAIKAMEEYGIEVLKYIHAKSQEYNIERIIFASLGDIVEDHMKHGVQSAVSTDSGLSEQMANAIVHMWEKILYPIFSLGIDTDVIGIAGNHGSSQHKGMDMYKAGLYSYDYTIYKSLELITKTAGFDNVDYIVPEGVFGYLNIYGNYAVYEHGYFNQANEKSISDQMKKRGQQMKKHVEYMRVGDNHHTCSYDCYRMILNGAFFGIDEGGTEYSGVIGFSSIPSQAVILHTPEERLGRVTAKELHVIQLA